MRSKVIKEINTTSKPSVIKNSDYVHKIAILDWDDTLIPTTPIFKNQQPSDGYTVIINQLHHIGNLVYQLLLKYITLYGRQNIFIVTNAPRKWVYLSLHLLNKMCKHTQFTSRDSRDQEQILFERNKTYFEAVEDLLISQTICIISGKDLYENQYPKQTGIWKHLVFQQIMEYVQSKNNKAYSMYSIISIGDSTDEFMAAKNATKIFTETQKINSTNVVLHRIKLKYAPSINEMIDEMRLILSLSDALYGEVSISQTIDYEEELKEYS